MSSYLDAITRVIAELPREAIASVLEVLERARVEERLLLIAGNGGSASTASHMAMDLMKTVAKDGRTGFRAIALTEVGLMSAVGNDLGFDQTFDYPVRALARPGDVLVVITCSGNSPNILRALESARDIGLTTIGLLGCGGGKAAELLDHSVIVNSDNYGLVEDAHVMLNHLITTHFLGRENRV